MLRQLTELLGNYGPVYELWLDGGWDKAKTRWPSTEIYDLVRWLQPDCLVSTNWTIVSAEKPDPNHNILVLNAPPDRSGRIRGLERNTLFRLRDKLGLSAGAPLPIN